MATGNINNLIPNSERTPEEVRENARKGGIKSGQVRHRKKLMKEQIDLLLSLPLKNEKMKEQLKGLGIKEKDLNNQMAMVIAMWQKALKGDVQAFNSLRDTVGEKPSEKMDISGNINNPYANLSEEELRKLAGD